MCLFSIIVPVYNVEKELNKCIDSILSQTISDFELILVDDGSKDKSGYICDEYSKKDERVKVIHKKNGGVSSARNKGLDIAKGKYLAFVDSDDYVNCDYLEKLYNPNVYMVFCGIKHAKVTGEIRFIIDNAKYGIFEIGEDIINSLIANKHINTVYSKMYCNSIIQKNNIRFNEDIPLGEDTMFVVDYISHIKNFEVKRDIIYNYIEYERETLSTFNEKSTYYLELCDEYIEKNLLEPNNIKQSLEYKRRKFGKYEWTIFQVLRSKKFSFMKKRKLLRNVFNNKYYIDLVKNIDDYMINDTQIVRDVLATRNVNVVMIFFYLLKFKSLLVSK